ncbi:hypothetical protein GQ53DRAFT_818244 [Thozetella sp. PMI_491]|nr:hypothetical protein GQ53DRAFT_818244 [Thozetella sp. PMI_491]
MEHQAEPNPVADVEDINSDDESFEPNEPIENQQLIKLVRTSAGAELFVNSVAQELLKLGQSNWGGMLGAAPDALGRLGQCFVLASDPLAASLVFPDSAGLPYKSLKANLVHCSDLGRKSFRDAESRMKKVSMVAQAVCEPDGTIDMIIEAVEDEDLAELDLPEQLAALKRVSSDCVADTKAIKEKVDAWSKFANDIHKACQDQDQTLGRNQTDLTGQIADKQLSINLKKERVKDVKAQTTHYRQILSSRQDEFNGARKSQNRGVMTDLGATAGEAIISTFKALASPFSGFDFNLSWGKSDENQQHYTPDPHDPMSAQDAGYAFAGRLLDPINALADLLTRGPDETRGVDWERLAGRMEPKFAVRYFQSHVAEIKHQFSREQSKVARTVRQVLKPTEDVAATIREIVRDERSVNVNSKELVSSSAKEWRERIMEAQSALGDIYRDGLDQAKKKELEKKEAQMSRAEIRYERFRVAQQSLFDAETMLNQRLEEEMKANEEFNAMQLDLQKLLTSQATMSQVKEIVGECVRHLQLFCDKIDKLTEFFTQMQIYIEDIDKNRVDPFNQTAKTTKALGDLAKAQSSEADREKKEKVKKRKLEQLRLKALELKGHYLVAQTMANTYVEVSTKHIMPGVSKIDRLSLPDASELSREERAKRITEVGDLATRARKEVKLLANARKDQFLAAMRENRGEIEEAK